MLSYWKGMYKTQYAKASLTGARLWTWNFEPDVYLKLREWVGYWRSVQIAMIMKELLINEYQEPAERLFKSLGRLINLVYDRGVGRQVKQISVDGK